MNNPVCASISRSALEHNIRLIKALSRPASVCAMLKGDAYGHCAALVARVLRPYVNAWGVATIAEAAELRALGARGMILVCCPLDDYFERGEQRRMLDAVIDLRLTSTIVHAGGLRLLARRARQRRRVVDVHVKLDSGMGRSGCRPEDLPDLLRILAATPWVRAGGIFSHFAASDAADLRPARRQLRVFHRVLEDARRAGVCPPLRHMANSAAIFRLPDARFDMVRPGIALYGYGTFKHPRAAQLRPVLELHAPLVMVKTLPKGHACGYGPIFVTRRRTRVGLVAAGYADGYSRRLSNTGWVDVEGRPARVLGRVSMDAIIVDLTNVPAAAVGSRVRLISNRTADRNSVDAIARRLDAIPHEVTCALTRRVVRRLTP